jgi:hypothetical protein
VFLYWSYGKVCKLSSEWVIGLQSDDPRVVAVGHLRLTVDLGIAPPVFLMDRSLIPDKSILTSRQIGDNQ